MNGLIEPNIHPALVHFALALTITSALAYALAALPAARGWRDTLRPAADWMLAFGAIAVVATIAAGFQAYFTVAHDGPSHAAMTVHRNWAVPSGLAVLALAVWRWLGRTAAPSVIFIAAAMVVAALLTTTAWWGGRLVYGFGLGVAGLPAASSDGHDHGPQETPEAPATESVAPSVPGSPESVVDAFAAALRSGDEAALRGITAPDVVIVEGGGVERSFDEYAGHHMPSDMAFASAVTFTLRQRDVIEGEDMATVVSRSEVEGRYRDREVHLRMMETMTLRRMDGDWRITHIHWSSSPVEEGH